MTQFYIDLGNRIKSVREASGLTREDVSKELGIGTQAWYYYETARRMIDLDMLLPFSKLVGVSAVNLIEGKSIYESSVCPYCQGIGKFIKESERRM